MYTLLLLLFSLTFAGGDEGVGIDPFGRPRTAQGDYTACIDPNGGCRGGRTLIAAADRGYGIDPNG